MQARKCRERGIFLGGAVAAIKEGAMVIDGVLHLWDAVGDGIYRHRAWCDGILIDDEIIDLSDAAACAA